jgi:hypothetical protein
MTREQMSDVDLCGEMRAFIDAVSRGGDESAVIQDAINSSVRRNRTYASGPAFLSRSKIRDGWAAQLQKCAAKYATSRSLDVFVDDIVLLVNLMNSEFPASFASSGFRIAHAQKSLALYLKHLWCRGDLAMPPACPVDRLMLTHAKAPYGLRTWTTTNDVVRYRQQLECLRTAANGKELAVWELVEFNRIAGFARA